MTTHLRWLVPSVLLLGAIAGGVMAWRSEATAGGERDGASSAVALRTPVLSMRRAPELVAAPVANRELLERLEAVAARLPERSCLAVAGPGISFSHRASEPMIPASTQKLLTTTAALEVLGSEDAVLDQVSLVLRDSHNPTAEALFEQVGGAATVAEVLADVGTPQVADGTGRSRDNRVTCQLLVDLILRPGTGELLGERLAVAGRSGTLTDRFVDTDLVGVLRAKTGSLTGVAALAGVVEDEDPPLTFALLVNTRSGAAVPDRVMELERELAEALARWPAVDDLTALGPVAAGG